MKLDSLEPNAHYDMAHGKPAITERDVQGYYYYRFNIVPEYQIPEGAQEPVQVGWMCYEVIVWNELTKDACKQSILRSVLNESEELALVNAYNSHLLGIEENEQAVAEYREYLTFRKDVAALLESTLDV